MIGANAVSPALLQLRRGQCELLRAGFQELQPRSSGGYVWRFKPWEQGASDLLVFAKDNSGIGMMIGSLRRLILAHHAHYG